MSYWGNIIIAAKIEIKFQIFQNYSKTIDLLHLREQGAHFLTGTIERLVFVLEYTR